jgi:hypothetical protein
MGDEISAPGSGGGGAFSALVYGSIDAGSLPRLDELVKFTSEKGKSRSVMKLS